MVSSRAHRVAVPESITSRTELAGSERVITYEVPAPDARSWSPEQWARATFEQCPAAVRWLLVFGFRFILGLRLDRSQTKQVLGWKMDDSVPGTVTLSADSGLMDAYNVATVYESHIVWTTLVRYRSGLGRPIWRMVELMHYRLMPYILNHAARGKARGVLKDGQVTVPRIRHDDWADKLADFTGRRRVPIAGAWVAIFLIGAVLAIPLVGSLSGAGWDVPGSGTVQVRNELAHGFTGRGETTAQLIVTDHDNTVSSPSFAARANQVYHAFIRNPTVKAGSSFGWSSMTGGNRSAFVGKDQRTVVTSVAVGLSDAKATRELPGVQKTLTNRFKAQGLTVSVLNIQAFQGEANNESVVGLVRGELIAFPLIVIVLLLLFRSIVATVAAFCTSMSAMVITLGIFGPISQHVMLSLFLANIVSMLGLGLGVDYSLIMIKRFKEELAAGHAVDDAVARTLRTAGHSVIASGITVVVASSALFLVRLNTIMSLALGAAVVAAVAMLCATILLPTLLHFLGERINSGRVWLPKRLQFTESVDDTHLTGHRWYRLAMKVMNRPVACLVGGTLVLLVLAGPLLSLKLLLPDTRILPSNSAVRTGAVTVADQFGPGYASPIQVVVSSGSPVSNPGTYQRLASFVSRVSKLPHVAAVQSALPAAQAASPSQPWRALGAAGASTLPLDAQASVRHFVSADGRRFVVEVDSTSTLTDGSTVQLLNQVTSLARGLPRPLHAAVGGETSRQTDVTREISSKIGWVIGLMLVAIYVVLFLAFRSVFLPLKAIALNALSVGATLGVLVLIFQDGWVASWLGLDKLGFQIAFVPLLILAIVVALGTDYEVFLLSRVREEYQATGDNRIAVARGLARTAPLITGAALLMVVVFGGFGLAGVVGIQELGVGLAIAVAIDATIVRMILVPAAMVLMGRWNWWRPGRGVEVRVPDELPARLPEDTPA
jgi:RND superfamily putative drug exporter